MVVPRVRIAPSPTGFAHVGTAYAALFNYAFAKKNKGKFVLRLENTDVKRQVPGAEEAIYEGLEWLGISWDEGPDKGGRKGPYRQSERLDLYREIAEKLIKKGRAYKDKGAVRFKNPGEDVGWLDLVRGEIKFPGGEVTDFVILKSDYYPTYNFAVAVDDIVMGITHVIRGEEHISNTPRQLAIYKALDKKPPEFAHLPTLRNEKRQKLSKRRDPVDLRFYQKEGYLPEALVNFLCLLGWSHPKEEEIFSLKEFVDKFDLSRVRKSGPVFDTKKLDWLNGEYIRQKPDKELARLLNDYITTDIGLGSFGRIVPLVRERIHKLSEAENLLSFFWDEPHVGRNNFPDKKAVLHISGALRTLAELKTWSLEEINRELTKLIKEKSFKTGDFYMSLRIALTGRKVTPPINESIEILGQDEVVQRLENAEKELIEIEPAEIA